MAHFSSGWDDTVYGDVAVGIVRHVRCQLSPLISGH